jgi:hypothetical protein
MMKKILHILCGGSLLILAGCAVQPGKIQIAVPFDPATRGEPSHRVDSANSWARVYVYRAGAMARLGHNHIVLTRDIGGELWMGAEPADAAFHLVLPVESLIVDPPELRAARYPTIEIWSERIRRSGDGLSADIVLAARGELSRVTVPVTIEEARPDMLIANGKFTLRQSDVGLAPFSVLMGAIAVRDELEIEYSITVESVSGIEDVLVHD